MSNEVKIGGLAPVSTLAFPGRLACVLLVPGRSGRCAYCHKPHPQSRRGGVALIRWSNVRAFLRRRVGLLDAVVFGGGEPTNDRALPAAMREARELGYAVGLHTAGSYPKRLEGCLPYADWVGMDVKADFARHCTTQVPGRAQRAMESMRLLLQSGVASEFRTTWHPDVMSEGEVVALTDRLASLGVQRYALQAFPPHGCDAPEPKAVAAPVPSSLVERLATRFREFELRMAD